MKLGLNRYVEGGKHFYIVAFINYTYCWCILKFQIKLFIIREQMYEVLRGLNKIYLD